jgi:hypothetical protein
MNQEQFNQEYMCTWEQEGDYVLATKYEDGDPQDQWCVGFATGMTHHNPPRFDVVDGEGHKFRGNGFRRVEEITREEGDFILGNIIRIEESGVSLWQHLMQFRIDQDKKHNDLV